MAWSTGLKYKARTRLEPPRILPAESSQAATAETDTKDGRGGMSPVLEPSLESLSLEVPSRRDLPLDWAKNLLAVTPLAPESLGYAIFQEALLEIENRVDGGDLLAGLAPGGTALLLPRSQLVTAVPLSQTLRSHLLSPRADARAREGRVYLAAGFEARLSDTSLDLYRASSPYLYPSIAPWDMKPFASFELSPEQIIEADTRSGPRSIPVYVMQESLERNSLLSILKGCRATTIEHRLGGLPGEIVRLVSSFVTMQRSHLEGPMPPSSEEAHAKSLADLGSEVQYFYQEVSGMLHDVVSGSTDLSRDTTPSAFEAPDESVSRALQQIEDTVCDHLYDLVRPLHASISRPDDVYLEVRIRAFDSLGISLRSLGVKGDTMSEADGSLHVIYEEICARAAVSLDGLMNEGTVSGKLRKFQEAHLSIVTGLRQLDTGTSVKVDLSAQDEITPLEPAQTVSDTAETGSVSNNDHARGKVKEVSDGSEPSDHPEALSSDSKGPSNDLLLPLLIHSLLKANPTRLCSQLAFIDHFAAPSLVSGQSSYCLTNVQAAMEFWMTVDAGELVAFGSTEDFMSRLQSKEPVLAADLRDAQAKWTAVGLRDDAQVQGQSRLNGSTKIGDVIKDGYQSGFGGLGQRARAKQPLKAPDTTEVNESRRGQKITILRRNRSHSGGLSRNDQLTNSAKLPSADAKREILAHRQKDDSASKEQVALVETASSIPIPVKASLSERLADVVRTKSKRKTAPPPAPVGLPTVSLSTHSVRGISNELSEETSIPASLLDKFLNCQVGELTLDQVSMLLCAYRRLIYKQNMLQTGSQESIKALI